MGVVMLVYDYNCTFAAIDDAYFVFPFEFEE